MTINVRLIAQAFLLALGFAASACVPANAQDIEKARGAIAGYTEIVALPMVCDYVIDDGIDVATMTNLKTLAAIAKLPPRSSEQILSQTIVNMVLKKENYCGKTGRELNALIADIGKRAYEMGQAGGAKLIALPAPKISNKTQKDIAVENMNLAVMLEAISDQCGIKLEGKDSLAIDRVQHYWRGAAGATAQEFKESQSFWAADAKAGKARVCAPEFGFRKHFDDMLKTIQ